MISLVVGEHSNKNLAITTDTAQDGFPWRHNMELNKTEGSVTRPFCDRSNACLLFEELAQG